MTDLPTIQQRRFMRALERGTPNGYFRLAAHDLCPDDAVRGTRKLGWVRFRAPGWELTDEGRRVLDKLAACA